MPQLRPAFGVGLVILVAPGLLLLTRRSGGLEVSADPVAEPTEQVGSAACSPVRIFDTHGQADEAEWTEVSELGAEPSDVRHLVLDNGIVRATYEYLNDYQEGSHTLRLWTGVEWARATSSWYGDYTYWVSSITEPATTATVTRLDNNIAEVTYVFEHGPADGAELVKRVALRRCTSGMFVELRGTPAEAPGEREFGIGEALPLAFSERAAALHPLAGRHVNLGLLAGDEDTAWAAAMGSDRILRVLSLSRPMMTLSYQFDRAHYGRVVVNQFLDGNEDDRYQAFLGAYNYDSSTATIEAETGHGYVRGDDAASGGLFATVYGGNWTSFDLSVPSDGEYSVWLRMRAPIAPEVVLDIDGDEAVFFPGARDEFALELLGEIELEAGLHSLTLSPLTGAVDLDAVLVLPVGMARELADGARQRMTH
jgi:hypothetical protein